MNLPFFKKKTDMDLPRETVIAVALSAVALIVSVGCMRWSYLLMDEQIQLRTEFSELQNAQDQLKIQFDHWDAKAGEQRMELRKMIDEMGAKK